MRPAGVGGGAQAPGPCAVVFLDGGYEDEEYYRRWAAAADLLVAADGGARFLLHSGLTPDLVVGDFDSLPHAEFQRLEAAGVVLRRHPVRKDRTDGELAVEEAVRRGAGEIVLAGALGDLDHTLGHLAILLRLATRRLPARVVAPQLCARAAVAPAEMCLAAPPGSRVSLVPLGGDATATLHGFAYTLDHGRLPADGCLGLGNEVTGSPVVAVHTGSLVALVARGDETFGLGRLPFGDAAQ